MSSIYIPKSDLTWLASALSKDRSRPVMTLAHLIHHGGCAWLLSSDTHRLHVIKLGDAESIPEMTLDIRMLLSDMTWHGSSGVQWKDGKWILVEGRKLGDPPRVSEPPSRYERAYAGNTPDWKKTVPLLPGPLKDVYAINWKYFHAACKKTQSRTTLRMDSPGTPLVITPYPIDPWKCEWFAVIMPMALGGDVE